MNKSLTLLIKPASGNCNLRCKYCFYHDVVSNRQVSNYGMMDEDTLEAIIQKAYEYVDSYITICFQGGEPMLRGLEFYQNLIDLVKKYNTKRIPTGFSLQTNGTLIDEDWATFFSKNKFLIGISLDGIHSIHNMNRVDTFGDGTFKIVSNATRICNQFHVEYNILCVVTRQIAKHVVKVYNYYKNNNYKYIQFIPCLEKLGNERGKEKYSLSTKLYEEFLITLFNEWYRDLQNGNYTSIRMFDNIVNIIKGRPAESCDMRGVCSRGTIIEADGSVYPCDFYVTDEWKIGNIHSKGFEEIINNQRMEEFVESSKNIDQSCRKCEFYHICRGGCKRHKEPLKADEPLKNYFCEAYKNFYSLTLSRFQQIARSL